MDQNQSKENIVDQTIAERGKVYGPTDSSHTNIGLAWTAILQQHFGIEFDHPIPNWIVALMMVQLKAQRSARVFKEDNFIDMHAYAKFAEEFQTPKEKVDDSVFETAVCAQCATRHALIAIGDAYCPVCGSDQLSCRSRIQRKP